MPLVAVPVIVRLTVFAASRFTPPVVATVTVATRPSSYRVVGATENVSAGAMVPVAGQLASDTSSALLSRSLNPTTTRSFLPTSLELKA